MDWTAFWTMVLDVFTFMLVVLAFFAGWQARSAAKAAWKAVSDQKERDRAAQASRVYSSPAQHRLNAAHLDEPCVSVVNASDLPIYDVVAVVEDQCTENRDELRVPWIMPGQQKDLYVLPAILTDQWGWIGQTDSHGNRYYTLPEGVQGPSYTVSLHYRDASNQRWHRDQTGTLWRDSD